jgi:monoamine oxidase
MAANFGTGGVGELRKPRVASNYLFRICNGTQPRFELKPYIFINHQYVTGTPILNSYDQGLVSTAFSQMSNDDLKDIFMEAIKEIMPDLSDPVDFVVQHWGTQKHVWGAYTDYGLGTVLADWTIWESPVGSGRNLWFAGEGYTSQNIWGTISSAYFSAVQVVAQIVAEDV